MNDEGTRLRRIVGQRLEDLQRAGLTHLPRSAPPAPAQAEPPARDATVGEISADAAPPSSPASAAATSERSLFREMEPPSPKKAVADVTERSTLTREQRAAQLAILADQVAGCTRCAELAESRTQTVFGVGDPNARILFVGEAPGADEDRLGEPFVGRAGQLLDKIITACRMKRDEIYICNVLKCRPPGNRNPGPDEAHNCREYLDGQIAAVDPDYIVCWGSVAATNLLDTKTSIGRLRGRFHNYRRAKVLCTYHPSYLLRNPAAKKDVWDDMKFLMRDLGVELDAG